MARSDRDRNLVAALSYVLGFVTGVVILLVEKQDKYIRFHAWQSIGLFGALFVVNLIVNLFFGVVSSTVSSIISLVSLVLWGFSIYKAYKGEMYKWPVVGNWAEKMVK